jgi:hypothetical protein
MNCQFAGESIRWLVTHGAVAFRGGDRVLIQASASLAIDDTDEKETVLHWQT